MKKNFLFFLSILPSFGCSFTSESIVKIRKLPFSVCQFFPSKILVEGPACGFSLENKLHQFIRFLFLKQEMPLNCFVSFLLEHPIYHLSAILHSILKISIFDLWMYSIIIVLRSIPKMYYWKYAILFLSFTVILFVYLCVR